MTRWFEDIGLGEVFPLGQHTFAAADMAAFAAAYDPQPVHTAGAAIVASGWHIAAVGQRLMIDALTAEAERLRGLGQEPGLAGPSPGVNIAEFTAPVRPGETLRYSLTVTAKRRSNSLPGWGVLINEISAVTSAGRPVYRAELVSFSKLRDHRMPLRLRLAMGLMRVPALGGLLRRGR